MDVKGAALGKSKELGDFLARCGAQRVRREAEIGAVERADDLLRPLEQFLKAIEIVDETALRRVRREAAESGMGIKNRQQREPDAGALGGLGDGDAELADVIIRRTVGRMVQIVKLADARKSRLQHFGIGERRNVSDFFGRQREGEAIHFLSPRPEIVVSGVAAPFRPSRKPALKGVAVEVGDSGKRDRRALVGGLRRDARLDLREDAALACRGARRRASRLASAPSLHRAIASPRSFEPRLDFRSLYVYTY